MANSIGDGIYLFITESEKLKNLPRHSWLSSGRRESVAEHTWRMALMAAVIAPEVDNTIDIGKLLTMIIIHDLAEIHAGDHWAFKCKKKNKHELELKALTRLIKPLPENTQKQFLLLWDEFEKAKSKEAKLAQAIDKLEVLMQHNTCDIKTWSDIEYEYNLTYGTKETEYNALIKQLRDITRDESKDKIRKEQIDSRSGRE